VPSVTTETLVGLAWTAPVFNGGSQVIDYQIWSDQATGSVFTLIKTNVTELSYTISSLSKG
jgi:hypothetical protein